MCAGLYVVSLLAGSQPGLPLAVGLYLNGIQTVITSAQLDSTNHNRESQSQLTSLSFDAGQSFYAGCFHYNNSYLYGAPNYQTMLSGFLYRAGTVPIVWTVATNDAFLGQVDPIPFPVVLFDRGSGWNPLTNQYSVLQSGTYYLHVTAGVAAFQPMRIELLINGITQADLVSNSTSHDGVKTRSRAIIWRLNRNDVIRLRLPIGYSLYGDNFRITTFTGFLLYE